MLFNWYKKLYRKYLLHNSFITALYINNLCASMSQWWFNWRI
jgi:hypothetical protein